MPQGNVADVHYVPAGGAAQRSMHCAPDLREWISKTLYPFVRFVALPDGREEVYDTSKDRGRGSGVLVGHIVEGEAGRLAGDVPHFDIRPTKQLGFICAMLEHVRPHGGSGKFTSQFEGSRGIEEAIERARTEWKARVASVPNALLTFESVPFSFDRREDVARLGAALKALV